MERPERNPSPSSLASPPGQAGQAPQSVVKHGLSEVEGSKERLGYGECPSTAASLCSASAQGARLPLVADFREMHPTLVSPG